MIGTWSEKNLNLKSTNTTKEHTKDTDSETRLKIEGYRTQFLSPDVTLFSFSSRSGRDDKRGIFLENVCYHSRDKSFEVYFWNERYDKNKNCECCPGLIVNHYSSMS